ncbi:MAG TPA: DUF4340 domain-containing protein [Cyclobacteriaceae bacterium]|jgi:hypothetical protein|nr:DUF4340 domain-containing protein [Cyclobacteriaceae bacterium]
MQRKKNIQLLISLTVMTVIIFVLFVFSNTKSGSSVDKDLFQIENLDKIDHVLLESHKGKTDLKFNGTKWVVNEKHEADRQMITVLFATLKQTIAKREVANRGQDSLQKEIATSGVKISCFESGSLSKEIWAGGNAQKTETYFQLKDGKPFVVTIPGYRVYVASIFELASNDWRNKQVFNFNWQNIKSLEVKYPADTRQSFVASFKDKFFSIEGIATDTTKLDRFMDGLFQLRSERILDSTEVKNYSNDLAQKIMMEIAINDIGNRSYPLTLYQPEKESRYIVGKINEEVVLINPLALKEIFRKRDYFIQRKQD